MTLQVKELSIWIGQDEGSRRLVDNVSFEVREGGRFALVGESGSGKSLCTRAVLGLLPRDMHASGSVRFQGCELLNRSDVNLRALRGGAVGLVFQDPMTTLHPLFRVGAQIAEAVRIHEPSLSRDAVRRRTLELLDLAAVPDAGRRVMQFPHELSGGIRQRICIAIAIANRPRLLIADEPTTALDSTVQASILRTVDELVAAGGMALWLISHDLGVVNQMTRQVAVMRAGQLIEAGETAEVLARPREDYTRTLVAAVPRLIARHGPGQEVTIGSDPLVQMHDVVKIYGPVSSRQVLLDHPGCVLRGVSLAVEKGSCLGIVGESGSGKSTLIKCMLGLVRLTRGKVTVMGNQLTSRGFRDARHLRGHVQMVFQDPFSSLNPRMRIGDIVSEPLIALGVPRNEAFARAMRCLQDVCLSPSDAERWPHQLSGGQRQRVGIARAIVTEPKLIVLDEPVSALDLTVQSSILDLLEILKERLGLTYVLVSHDLGVIARLATDVAVMARGVIVEKGNPVEILSNPKHHITRTLIECSLAHDFG